MIIFSFLLNLALFQIPAAPFAWAASRMAKSSRDEWQLLAWVPAAPLMIWGVIVAFAVTRDPTSHNLWPFEAVIWGALSVLLLIGVRIAHRFALRAENAREAARVRRHPPTSS